MAPQSQYTASSTSVSSTSASTSAPIEFNPRHDHIHAVPPGLRPHTRPGHFGGTVSKYRDYERYLTPSGPPTPASSGQTSGASTPAPITPAEAPHDYYFEPAVASGSSQPGSIIRADTIPLSQYAQRRGYAYAASTPTYISAPAYMNAHNHANMKRIDATRSAIQNPQVVPTVPPMAGAPYYPAPSQPIVVPSIGPIRQRESRKNTAVRENAHPYPRAPPKPIHRPLPPPVPFCDAKLVQDLQTPPHITPSELTTDAFYTVGDKNEDLARLAMVKFSCPMVHGGEPLVCGCFTGTAKDFCGAKHLSMHYGDASTVKCFWPGCKEREMKRKSLGRHLMDVHLKLVCFHCPYCHVTQREAEYHKKHGHAMHCPKRALFLGGNNDAVSDRIFCDWCAAKVIVDCE